MPALGDVIGESYTVKAQIGGGADWQLFAGEDGQHNAVLIECDTSGAAMRLRGEAFSPPAVWWDDCVVVYGYDGVPLRMISARFPDGRLPMGVVIALAPLLIDLVRVIHEAGFIHGNLGLGTICAHGDEVRVVGMRTATEIPRVLEEAISTADGECMPLRGHLNLALSRRDDLESVLMVLVLLARGRLPWSGKGREEIGAAKLHTTLDSLCVGVPRVFRGFAEQVTRLGFDTIPRYADMAAPFVREAARIGVAATLRWEPEAPPPPPRGLPTLVIDSGVLLGSGFPGARAAPPVIDENVLREWRLRRQGVGRATFPRSAVVRPKAAR